MSEESFTVVHKIQHFNTVTAIPSFLATSKEENKLSCSKKEVSSLHIKTPAFQNSIKTNSSWMYYLYTQMPLAFCYSTKKRQYKLNYKTETILNVLIEGVVCSSSM